MIISPSMTPRALAIGHSLRDMELFPPGREKAAHYLAYGLAVSGEHHKQWFLEQALLALGVDLSALRRECNEEGVSCEEGIAP